MPYYFNLLKIVIFNCDQLRFNIRSRIEWLAQTVLDCPKKNHQLLYQLTIIWSNDARVVCFPFVSLIYTHKKKKKRRIKRKNAFARTSLWLIEGIWTLKRAQRNPTFEKWNKGTRRHVTQCATTSLKSCKKRAGIGWFILYIVSNLTGIPIKRRKWGKYPSLMVLFPEFLPPVWFTVN